MSIEFLITSLIVVASPGIGAVFTISTGLSYGPRKSLVAALGCTLGILPHLMAALTGLAAVLHSSAMIFNAVKYVGVVYLLYMDWNALRETGALSIQKQNKRSDLRMISDAVLANLLNPKLSIFFVAFLPQFISEGDEHPLVSMIEMSGVFMLLTFIVFALYGIFAALMRDYVVTRPKIMQWLRRSFSAAFTALAVKLAVSQR